MRVFEPFARNLRAAAQTTMALAITFTVLVVLGIGICALIAAVGARRQADWAPRKLVRLPAEKKTAGRALVGLHVLWTHNSRMWMLGPVRATLRSQLLDEQRVQTGCSLHQTRCHKLAHAGTYAGCRGSVLRIQYRGSSGSMARFPQDVFDH